ncbi:MAG: Gfo/Idh/MocA family oxidoreductase [Candidatus Sumerlaeota bacterium]|nr:Gfo/Idh/MocA family oxidoreductase [Candidatus Sumerlaeota bacterium]
MPAKIEGKIRVAIIGTGGISAAHARGILAYKDRIECVALCDISEANLKTRSEQLGGVKAGFSDWNEMLKEMGSGLDAVIICLPHHLHAAAIMDAAAAGKHILCEKPMCITLEEADRILEAVRRSGITYMSAHNQLFMASVQEARNLIDQGEIGAVHWIRSQDCFLAGGGKSDPFKGSWRASLKTQGGGELIDTGYHPTYRLLYLAKANILGVRGSMGRYAQHIEGEDTASVQVRFDNGVIGEIFTSWAMPLPYGTQHIRVIGSKGQIFGTGNDLYILRADGDTPEKRALPNVETFTEQIRHFIDCLAYGRRPIHGPEEGKIVLEVILKAMCDADGWQKYAQKKV